MRKVFVIKVGGEYKGYNRRPESLAKWLAKHSLYRTKDDKFIQIWPHRANKGSTLALVGREFLSVWSYWRVSHAVQQSLKTSVWPIVIQKLVTMIHPASKGDTDSTEKHIFLALCVIDKVNLIQLSLEEKTADYLSAPQNPSCHMYRNTSKETLVTSEFFGVSLRVIMSL